MVLGLTAWAATFGLVVVFFVIFPVLAQGLIAFAIAVGLGEKRRERGVRAPPPHARHVGAGGR